MEKQEEIMSVPPKRWRKWAVRLLRWTAYSVFSFFLLFFTLLFALQFDAVQNAVLPVVTRFASNALKTRIEIESVSIALMDKIVLNGFKMYDKQDALMIEADEVYVGIIDVNFWEMLFPVRYETRIGARIVELHHASLLLYTKNGDVNIEKVFEDNDTTPSRRDLFISFPNIYLEDFYFRMIDSSAHDSERVLLTGHWNYQNLHLIHTRLEGGFYYHKRDVMRIDVRFLTTQEKNTALRVDTLQGFIKVKFPNPNLPDTIPYFQFTNMLAKVGNSRLDFDALIYNDAFPTLFKGTNPKDYRISFRPTYVTFQDISYFIPKDTLPLWGQASITGNISMNLNTIKGKDLLLAYNNHSLLNADIRLDQYTSPDIFINVKLKNSTLYTADIDSLLSEVSLPTQIANLGSVQLEGKFIGFPKDFVADAVFEGDVGIVTTDINMKIAESEITYKGYLKTEHFNLDQFFALKDTVSPSLNFEGQVEGKNFAIENINTKAEFVVTNSPLFKTFVDSIGGNLTFQQKTLKGFVHLNDREADAKVNVLFDFNQKPTYNIAGDLYRLNLKHFDITEEDYELNSILDLKFSGDSLEDMQGFCRLYKAQITHLLSQKILTLDDAELRISHDTKTKNIEWNSDWFHLNLLTDFGFTEVPEFFTQLATEIHLYWKNQPDSIQAYYNQKKRSSRTHRWDANLTILNLKPVFQFFDIKAFVAPKTTASVQSTLHDYWDVQWIIQTDSASYSSVKAYNLQANGKLQKNQSANLWNTYAVLGSEKMKAGELLFSNLKFHTDFQTQSFSLTLSASQNQKELQNALLIHANGTRDSLFRITIDTTKSFLQVGPTRWTISPTNQILLAANYLKIQDFQWAHDEEFMDISGEVSEEKNKITFRIHDLKLETIHKVYPLHPSLKGFIDTKVVVQKPFSDPLININGQIDQLEFKKIPYGRFVLVSQWHEATELLKMDLGLIQQNDTLIALAGIYNPLDKVSPLSFSLKTSHLKLKLIEPFINEYTYDLNGEINLNDFQIYGQWSSPEIYGVADLNGVSLGVRYLKTKFYFTQQGSIRFNRSNMTLAELLIMDTKGKTCLLNGYFNYKNFNQLQYKFTFSNLQNFTVMNTAKNDNELFYGRGIVRRGWIEISGDNEIVQITGDITTDEGTVLNIPINSYIEGSRLNYVFFKGTEQEKQKAKIKLSGLKLNLHIEATPEAELNIIFDEKAGDIIHGNGSGNLVLSITLDGEFSMLGKYNIQKGNYLFTTQNVINKKFLLEEGGSISWTGDPYEAAIDIKAIYKVNASLATLDTTLKNSSRVQVQVLMHLKGSLLNPEIHLSLMMPTLTQNDAVTVVQQFRNIENDPQELNRQVFSLLMFGRFAPPSSFFGQGAGGSGATASFSELLSNQLNNWLSQSLKEEVGISLSSNRFDDITVLVQAKLFNNRVTVSRDGAIMNTANRDLTLGNISIHIKLLPGPSQALNKPNALQLAIEIFNRESLSYANTLLSSNRGIGIFFKKDFDSLIEILKGK